MKSVNWNAAVMAGLAGLAGVGGGSALGEQILNYTPEIHNRFSSIQSGHPITTTPVNNASPNFILAGYDVSGIFFNRLSRAQSGAMISPIGYAFCQHISANYDPNTADTLLPSFGFLGANGQDFTAYHSTRIQLKSDASLGVLTAPIPNSAQVTYYPIIDKGDAPSSYYGTPVYVHAPGWQSTNNSTVIGAAKIDYAYNTWGNGANAIFNDSYAFSRSQFVITVLGGDSGNPNFITHNNQLTLAGTTSGTFNGTAGSYAGGVSAAWFNPYNIARANVQLKNYGYAVKVLVAPTKDWGGTNAGTGDFNTAGNWTTGTGAKKTTATAAPTKEGVRFDGSLPDCRFDVNFSSTPSVKGFVFDPAASPSGFTFSGSPVQIGTAGILNDNAQTQTFNNNIHMYYLINFDTANPTMTTGGQHWSANQGNIVVNGSVANNGFQLVVDGARDTAINGAISGSGGVGKEGAGKLTLSAASTYSGNTTLSNGTLAVNNVSGSGTGTGNLTVWGGRLQGNGAIGGSITFHANGDATELAPGNADLGMTGRLTVNNSVTLSNTTTAEFHLNGLLAGSQHDQLMLTSGNVDLAGAILELVAADFAVNGGEKLWLINNAGTGSLLGEFAGLASGDVVTTISGLDVQIYYGADFGSDALTGGNDVVLSVVPEPSGLGAIGAVGMLLMKRRRA